jgi:hypothetical protein
MRKENDMSRSRALRIFSIFVLLSSFVLLVHSRPILAQPRVGHREHSIPVPAFAYNVTVADWDSDGEVEIVATLLEHAGYPQGALVCYEFNLTTLEWDEEFKLAAPTRIPTNVAVGDVTGDGINDIVFGTDDGDAGGYLYVVSNRSIVWRSDLIDAIRRRTQLSVGDVDEDGICEMLLAVSWNGRYLAIYDDENAGYARTVLDSGTDGHSSDVGDIDGDGNLEAVFGMGITGTSAGRVLAYKWTGSGYTQIWNAPSAESSARAFVQCGDTDGDGIDEVVVVTGQDLHTVAIYDGGSIAWSSNRAPNTVGWALLCVGNALNIGREQVIFSEFAMDGRKLVHILDWYGVTYRTYGTLARQDDYAPIGRPSVGDPDKGGLNELIVPELVGDESFINLYHLEIVAEPTPTATMPGVSTPTPSPTPGPTTQVVTYYSSPGDLIYRIDAAEFVAYDTVSASNSPLHRITSPPAPLAWQEPQFIPGSAWQPGREVWWELWDLPAWRPLPTGAHTIGLYTAGGYPEGKNGTTHLYRREFDLTPPDPGMRIQRAQLEMWSDNKSEWWWQGTSITDGHEGYGGRLELFPGHVAPQGGHYVLAIQNSNDLVCAETDYCNPQGTAFRLTVTWSMPGTYQLFLPLIVKG